MLTRSNYIRLMKVAYLYNRPAKLADDWSADRVFADTPDTRRVERADMIEHGLRDGDVLLLAARGDLGRGREVPALIERIEAHGVAIQIMGEPETPKKPGRNPKLDLTQDQEAQICRLWRSGLEQSYVLRRAAEIAGVDVVTRNQMNRACGHRHKRN